ncbi:hypothetical protein [Tenacibaculum finnmarkense]|uniref:hypothetical protein n=1 Tax=Tenacibaculum finnmarkense TaxID=2781243 RepID=UPI001E58E857|nr:hypothetical protein [Tenacibaculum finnmarkense]MCD8436014.1 hypothetical protein [Tenacibaculum dicentrarchi]MCG8203548.1 hypothetical protein [Tenacibaculum finnmarkense genomovar finnmarkense]MCG8247753.1 hypothetical protein [Tenacibaculum finnmarkense genomovar finnmarkense]MCG8250524.1 hypothetical protein [Tenacibaculum finnmarkense genomovar finnmarkense]MCG8719245.1 hypothetical protein [Tenacibaculum finnmarkense]
MKLTVKELIIELKKENQELEVDFGGLEFYRLKDRGGCLQIEFKQSVYLAQSGDVVVENH